MEEIVHKQRKIRSLEKTYPTEIVENFMLQARKLFLEFAKIHDIGGERFPNFSMSTVKWSINKSNIIFYILNDDESLRSFIIIGSSSDWNFELRIELLAGEKEDYIRLIEEAKNYAKNRSGLIITTLCYPSQELYDIYEECGFIRIKNIRRIKDNSIKFVKYEFTIYEENQEFYLEELNLIQVQSCL